MAKWMPSSCRALDRQVARLGGAAAEADRVEPVEELRSAVMSTPTFVPGRKTTPSASICRRRRSRRRFSILKSGMP